MAFKVKCNRKRAELIGSLIGAGGFGPIHRMELDDPQYKAMKKLSESIGAGPAMVVAVATALVSYRLPMRGEEWWTIIADRVSRERPKSFEDILNVVKTLLNDLRVPLMRQKKARLERISSPSAASLLGMLAARPRDFPSIAPTLIEVMSKVLRQKPYAKTLTFAIKMAYYVYKAAILAEAPTPLKGIDVPMPIDSRVACLSIASSLCDSRGTQAVISNPAPAQDAWRIVASTSGIPSLHLDALAWRIGWIPRDAESVESAREAALRLLSRYYQQGLAKMLAKELIQRLCRSSRSGI